MRFTNVDPDKEQEVLNSLSGAYKGDWRKSPKSKEEVEEASPTMHSEIVKPLLTVKHKWYDYEIILQDKVCLIHIFPGKRGLRDELFMGKMQQCVKDSVIKNISHLKFLAEYVEEVESFCISYMRVVDCDLIARRLMEEFHEALTRSLA